MSIRRWRAKVHNAATRGVTMLWKGRGESTSKKIIVYFKKIEGSLVIPNEWRVLESKTPGRCCP